MRASACLLLTLGLLQARSLAAQELPFLRDHPQAGAYTCEAAAAPTAASPEARAQALELTSGGYEAVILGDLARAQALFDRAVELDPTAPELAYQRARVLEDRGENRTALDEYCRALALAPEGQLRDARDRVDALASAEHAAIPEDALVSFEVGLAATDRGALSQALISFERAATSAPLWASAEYNRGVTLARLGRGREAATALLRYLELRPDAPDGLAVSQRIGQLESLAARETPRPGVAATLGVLVPGMGHFYTGRPLGGLAVLGLAGGAIAAGFLIEDVDVRCLSAVDNGQACPADQVVSRTSSRPHLTLALATAAAVGVVGAIEAFFGARRMRGDATTEVRAGPSLEGPEVVARSGRVDVRFLGLRFR
jgi:tetratricopeptide (TPR) repeat protein